MTNSFCLIKTKSAKAKQTPIYTAYTYAVFAQPNVKFSVGRLEQNNSRHSDKITSNYTRNHQRKYGQIQGQSIAFNYTVVNVQGWHTMPCLIGLIIKLCKCIRLKVYVTYSKFVTVCLTLN